VLRSAVLAFLRWVVKRPNHLDGSKVFCFTSSWFCPLPLRARSSARECRSFKPVGCALFCSTSFASRLNAFMTKYPCSRDLPLLRSSGGTSEFFSGRATTASGLWKISALLCQRCENGPSTLPSFGRNVARAKRRVYID